MAGVFLADPRPQLVSRFFPKIPYLQYKNVCVVKRDLKFVNDEAYVITHPARNSNQISHPTILK